jgi:hypothetical protein
MLLIRVYVAGFRITEIDAPHETGSDANRITGKRVKKAVF